MDDLLYDSFGDDFGGLDLGNLGNLLGSAATAAAGAAGIDPSVVAAASNIASTPLAKAGFAAGLTAAVGATSKTAPHKDPAVVAAKAALPVAAHAGFDAGASLAAGHAKTGGVKLPGPPTAQALSLMAHGAPSRAGWIHIGIGAMATGTVVAIAGLKAPVVLGVAALAAGAVYLLDPRK